MSPEEAATRVAVGLIVKRDFDTLARLDRGDRVGGEVIERVLAEYGREPVDPPDEWWSQVSVTRIETPAGDPARVHVAAPLWTREEGRSDLTLELELTEIGDGLNQTSVLDLHVL